MTYRIGTRVREVETGDTGIVVSHQVEHEGHDIVVALDHACRDAITGESFVPGEWADAASEEWEPIVPRGQQPATWAECLWQPKGITA